MEKLPTPKDILALNGKIFTFVTHHQLPLTSFLSGNRCAQFPHRLVHPVMDQKLYPCTFFFSHAKKNCDVGNGELVAAVLFLHK